jgi:glyoxylase-like metal-dependent hydrolase (beta-lactamase superfamily II)
MPGQTVTAWDDGPMADDVPIVAGSDTVRALGDEIYQIDTQMAGYPGITAGYLIRSDRPCLVETGTAPSAPVVRDALATLGVGADDLATVVITHIHLDHAGGVGDIAEMSPGPRWSCTNLAPGIWPTHPGSWRARGWCMATNSTLSSARSRRPRPTASAQ